MKRKMPALLTAAAIVAALGTAAAFRLTAIDVRPQAPAGPVATFATEAFAVDLPAGFKPYLITYALYWPDGRIVFEEMAVKWPLKSATSRIEEVEARPRRSRDNGDQAAPPAVSDPAWLEDLSPVMGCPAALVLDQSAAGSQPGSPAGSLPLVMEVQVGEGWLRFFEAAGTDARHWNPALAGERYPARRDQFVSRVKAFLEHYVWTGLQTPPLGTDGPGIYKTRYGLIHKSGNDDFVYSIALARFIDDDRRMGLNIDARLGYYDWGGLQLCEADRLTRIADQIALTDSFLARTNCRRVEVGGRPGYEMIVSEGLGALKPGGSYLLDWQEDWTTTRVGSFLLSFHLTSPNGGALPDSPEVVVGQWRAMLESVRPTTVVLPTAVGVSSDSGSAAEAVSSDN